MNSIHQQKLQQIQSAYSLNRRVIMAIIILCLLIVVKKLDAQDKLIGFNSEQNSFSRGNAYQINIDGTNYQINAKFPWTNGGGIVEVVDGNDGFIYGINGGDGYSFAGSVFRVKYNGDNYQDLKIFSRNSDGGSCRYRPALGADGFIYGVNENGGLNNRGTIWKVRRDGTNFNVIYHFPTSVGSTIYAGVGGDYGHTGVSGSATFGLDGRLYIFCDGGSYGGHIFRINTDGTGFNMLFHTTANIAIPGSGIRGPLTLGSDGFFYGSFVSGGNFSSRIGNGAGVVFKFNPYNNTYTPLHLFAANANEGTWPMAVQEGPGGFLYGACYNSGIPNGIETDHGTVWKLSKDGSSFAVLKQLEAATTGNGIEHKLVAGPNGKIYFSTHNYGISGASGTSGCLMSINPDGSDFRIIRSTFEGQAAPASMFYRVDETGAKFYGMGLGTATYLYKLDSSGSNFENIIGLGRYNYGGNPMHKPLVINNSSTLNRSVMGIAPNQGFDNGGIVFKYNPDMVSNSVANVVSGMRNVATGIRGVVNGNFTPLLASDGFLYGHYTYYTSGSFSGTEAIYKLSTNSRSQPIAIKTFSNVGTGTTGCSQISSALIELPDGFMYGTTASGGNNFNGTIFKVRKDGSGFTNIHHFTTYRDKNTLVYDAVDNKIICASTRGFINMNTDGSALTNIPFSYAANFGIVLQGNTIYGIYGSGSNWGIYKMNKSGSGFTSLRTFTGTSQGYYPNMEITLDNTNKIYGTTIYGGSFGEGVLYKIDTDGNNFTILKHYNRADGGGIPGPVSFRPCAAPNNATNITFYNSTNNTITLSGFTAPETGANGYVIKMNSVNSFSTVADGVNPAASLIYSGGEQVIYNGSSIPTSLTVSGLNANTTYYFKVFAYSCTSRLYSNANTEGNPSSYRTVTNGLERVRGRMMHCNGINQFADAGDVNSIEDNAAISFGGWVKPTAFPTATLTQKSIICKGDGVNATSTSFFIKFYLDEVDYKVKLSAGISISGIMTPINLVLDSQYFKVNQWSHLFVTWQNGETIKLYINGKLAAQSLTTEFGLVNNISLPLRLGSSTATSERNWSGDLEEIQFYNSRLSLCEIRQRMHNTLLGTEPNLQAYYQFNDATSSLFFADYIGLNNAIRVNGVTNPSSDLAVAFGNSYCDAIYSTNLFSNYAAIDASNYFGINFSSDVPNGDINVSYLTENPVGGLPVSGNNVIAGYWIVNNFGMNTGNLNSTINLRLPDGIITDTVLSHYTLFNRASASYGSWMSIPIATISLVLGNQSISITGLQNLGQFLLVNTHIVAPPSISIFSTNFNICAGSNSTVIATATNAGVSPIFNFFVNGVSVQNSTSNSYSSNTFNNNDVVTCSVIDGVRTATSNSIIYTVRSLPTVASIIGTTTNCSIGTTTRLSNATSGGTWFSNNQSIATVSSTGLVTAISNGSVTIEYTVVNSNGCSATSSIIYNIAQVTMLPVITGSSSTLCVGSTLTLSNAIPSGIWSTASIHASISSLGVVTGNTAGSTSAIYTVTNSFGCRTSVSYPLNIISNPPPPSMAYAPGYLNPQCSRISGFRTNARFGVLVSPTGGLWTSTGSIASITTLPSGVTEILTGNTTGIVSFTYSYAGTGGCRGFRTIATNVYNAPCRGTINQTVNKEESQFVLFPNPASSFVKIKVENLVGFATATITDLLGKQIKQQTLSVGENLLDISNITKGMYILNIIYKDKLTSNKLVIN